MKKFPYIQLYTGDFLKDPRLSLCAPSTRGIWVDLLCAMHDDNRSDEVKATIPQIARLCRATEEEAERAIAELNSTKTADVTFCNGNVTVKNRRMKRQFKARKSLSVRVKRHRNAKETPLKRPGNAPRARISSSSSSSYKKEIVNSEPSPEKSPVPLNEIFDLFQRLCPSMPRLRMQTEARKAKTRLMWNEFQATGQSPLSTVEELFKTAEASDFLTARNGTRKTAFGYDWIIQAANRIKILEGNYANASPARVAADQWDGKIIRSDNPIHYGVAKV